MKWDSIICSPKGRDSAPRCPRRRAQRQATERIAAPVGVIFRSARWARAGTPQRGVPTANNSIIPQLSGIHPK